MAQQINLHTPILLQAQQMFSAATMAIALGGLALVLALSCGGLLVLQRFRLGTFDETVQRQAAERRQLQSALAAARAGSDPLVLGQQLVGLQKDIQALSARAAAWSHLSLATGHRHSAMLAEIARTLPAPNWVTGLRLDPDEIEISGLTLDPGALQSWIVLLEASPILAGRHLGQVRVEQVGARLPVTGAAGVSEPPLPAPAASGTLQLPAWAFRIAITEAGRLEVSP